jgi:hypothetical protein
MTNTSVRKTGYGTRSNSPRAQTTGGSSPAQSPADGLKRCHKRTHRPQVEDRRTGERCWGFVVTWQPFHNPTCRQPPQEKRIAWRSLGRSADQCRPETTDWRRSPGKCFTISIMSLKKTENRCRARRRPRRSFSLTIGSSNRVATSRQMVARLTPRRRAISLWAPRSGPIWRSNVATFDRRYRDRATLTEL